jgi:APA family basic amino acid/polyamine antiporter
MNTRQLGFWMCTALVVGNMIGMGIFVLPASLAPLGFNAFLGWAATVLGCALLAIVFAILARRMPEADGPFHYIRATLGETVAFAALWCYWISIWIAKLPSPSALPISDERCAAIGARAASHCCGEPHLAFRPRQPLGRGGRVQVLTAALKLVPLALVIVRPVDARRGSRGLHRGSTAPTNLQSTMRPDDRALRDARPRVRDGAMAAAEVEKTIHDNACRHLLTAAVLHRHHGISTSFRRRRRDFRTPFVDVLDRLLGAGNGRCSRSVIISGLGCTTAGPWWSLN